MTWIRPSMWDGSIELGTFDHWVITSRPPWKLAHWLESGLQRIPGERARLSIHAALAGVDDREVPALWRCLYEYVSAGPRSRWELEDVLARRARDPIPEIIVLERLVERASRTEPRPPEPERLSLRTATEHYVIVQALDAERKPMPGLSIELLIADGEMRHVRTNAEGIARAERIQAGRVVIRVLGLDGALWRPLDGAASQPSSTQETLRWHTVSRGESLSQIAGHHGLESWKQVWEHAHNATLRKERHRPGGVCPGDVVAVPPPALHELIRETDATHRIEVQRRVRRGVVLDTQDLFFHRGSCVFLGECSAVTDPEVLSGASGIDALAKALRFARDRPEKRLLLAGHCDASGDSDLNQRLSEQRALALQHLLSGQREEWVRQVGTRCTIADYQQILGWISLTYGWPCTPFAVDDREDPDNRRVLLGFQAAYNQHFGASIAEDGQIGPETWGAIFDVYQEQLAVALETDDAGLGALRQQLKFCASAASYGCASFFASHAAPGSAPARLRRAEILFFDAGDEPGAEDLEQGPLLPPAFVFESLPVERSRPLVWFSLQTVDDLGFRLGNVALVVVSDGVESERATDGDGVWRGQLRAGSSVEVRRADGGAVRLGSSVVETESVRLHASWAAQGTTDLVIVGRADPALLAAQREQLRRYAAIPENGARTARGVLSADEPLVGEPIEELPRDEGQPRAFTRRFYHSWVADNLLLAAHLSTEELPEVIGTWLGDYYPEIARRGFFVQIMQGRELLMLDASGALLGRFHLSEDAQVSGRMGLYALLESDRVSSGAIFADLASASTSLAARIGSPANTALKPAHDDMHSESVAAQPHDVFLRELVLGDEREAFLERCREQIARGRAQLIYYVPEQGLGTYARVGGTGLLEPYPTDSVLRRHVHARNRAIASSSRRAYGEYIEKRIDDIRAIDPDPEHAELAGKPHPEDQLRALGDIDGGAVFPRPPGAGDSEHRDILGAAGDVTGYRAYQSWTEKYNQIFHMRTSGSAWLACEVSIEPGVGRSKAKIKLNFEASTDAGGAVTVTPALSQGGNVGPSQVEVEIDKNGTVKAKGKGGALGPFEIELSNRDAIKLGYRDVSVVYDAGQQQVRGEVTFSLRDLVRKSAKHRWGAGGEPEWVAKLPDLKVKAQMGMQLSRVDEVTAVLTRAPGPLERKPRHNFGEYQWSTMTPDEKAALQLLGFDQHSWDVKIMPESTKRPFLALTPEQQVIVRRYLPIPTAEGWEAYWQHIREVHLRRERNGK